jgi:hypothetical protein
MQMKLNFYKIVSVATAVLFVFLFFQFFFSPEDFIRNLGLQPSVATSLLCRRVSMFFLGLSILFIFSRNQSHSKVRQLICLSAGIILIGLACTGCYELYRRTVNASMLQAIAVEVPLGLSFLSIFLKNRKIEIFI